MEGVSGDHELQRKRDDIARLHRQLPYVELQVFELCKLGPSQRWGSMARAAVLVLVSVVSCGISGLIVVPSTDCAILAVVSECFEDAAWSMACLEN